MMQELTLRHRLKGVALLEKDEEVLQALADAVMSLKAKQFLVFMSRVRETIGNDAGYREFISSLFEGRRKVNSRDVTIYIKMDRAYEQVHKKINAIKYCRAITHGENMGLVCDPDSMGLKEAKDLVEASEMGEVKVVRLSGKGAKEASVQFANDIMACGYHVRVEGGNEEYESEVDDFIAELKAL